jgi:hypothetical protein
MRFGSSLFLFIAISTSTAVADDQCGSENIACEMAAFYAAAGKEFLPVEIDAIGLKVVVESVYSDGPTVVVSGTTLLTAARITSDLVTENLPVSDLQTIFEEEITTAVCNAPEGHLFLDAGGQVITLFTTADGKPLVATTVQSCPGGY